MKHCKIILAVIALLTLSQIKAQQKFDTIKGKQPIGIEFLGGNNRLFSQVIINRSITENGKLGILNISSFAVDYKNDLTQNENLNFSSLKYKLTKQLSLNAGITYTTIEGLKPIIGFQYQYSTKGFSIIYLPAYYYLSNHKLFNLLQLEYKPKISNGWFLYSKLQANYQYDFENKSHFRSFLYSRFGAAYKDLCFGVGANLDQYGVKVIFKENYGVFVQFKL